MAVSLTGRVAFVLVVATACGRQTRECRAVTARANTFIADSEKLRPAEGASKEQTREQALATAHRYERLAADLAALGVESSDLAPEVERYRALALRSAAALRSVAVALASKNFDAARALRVDLDQAARGEAPLVARINAICD